MYVAPLLASLVAFVAGVLLLEITRVKRSGSKGLNLALIAIALLLSLFIAAYTSQSPEASGGHLVYLWVAYAIFSSLVRKKTSVGAKAGQREPDDPKA